MYLRGPKMTPNLRDHNITLLAEAMCFFSASRCLYVCPPLCIPGTVSGEAEGGRARRHGLLVGGTIASL